ncbi:hypothetical protein BN2537_7983 [Streptomyces venezuelae]|nr:hypothetical protein BN2537_7983 [Streptomyces venezuelae]
MHNLSGWSGPRGFSADPAGPLPRPGSRPAGGPRTPGGGRLVPGPDAAPGGPGLACGCAAEDPRPAPRLRSGHPSC